MNVESYRPGDRRPIASRERKGSQLAAQWLARRRISPNAISIWGMICGLASGLAFAATSLRPDLQRWGWILGAIFAQLRLLANMFDGMVAIATGRASPVGELYNEVPDRISDAAILIGVGCAWGGDVSLGIAAAGVAIFTAYARAIGKVAGAPQEFCGPMAKQQRMFLVTLLAIYNGLTPASWQPLWSGGHGLAAMVLIVIIVGGLLTACRRLLRTGAALRKLRP